MQLIAPLAAGIAGCADGTVDIYLRGTSSRATVYADFEANTVVPNTAALTLDGDGGYVLYVGSLVDCIARDSDGNIVREFVAGDNAASVEVISSSFTGVDYDSGASAASLPVTLATVLDRWLTSAGATDWNLLSGSSTLSIKNAFASVAGLFFNVKSPTYGALGDGSTDDGTAIAAAITAAQVAGGIVFFPPGTYRVTAAITFSSKISMMGAGSGNSILTIDHATENLLTIASASNKEPQFIQALQLKTSQANTGNLLNITGAAIVDVRDCYFGDSNTSGRCAYITSASGLLRITDSALEVGGGSANHIEGTSGGAWVDRCRMVIAATSNAVTVKLGAGGIVRDTIFYNATATAGTYTNIQMIASTYGAHVSGCVFPNTGGATLTPIVVTSDVKIGEVGCQFGSTVTLTAYTVGASAATHALAPSESRNARRYYVASDAASLTINPNIYSVLEVERTTNGNQALTLTTPTQSGLDCVLIYNNDQAGGGGTITWTGNVEPAAATFAVNANKVTYHWLRSVETKQGNLYWAQYGTLANQTP